MCVFWYMYQHHSTVGCMPWDGLKWNDCSVHVSHISIPFFLDCSVLTWSYSLHPTYIHTHVHTHSYLELADWDVQEAVRAARQDKESRQDPLVVVDKEGDDDNGSKKSSTSSGDIHITVKLQKGMPVDIRATGAGLQPPQSNQTASSSTRQSNKKNGVFDGVPAIATKSVRPQDVYNVSEPWLASWF